MKCKVLGCSRPKYKNKIYCQSHYRRLLKYSDVYFEISLRQKGGVPLPILRKALQAKSGFRYCRYCDKYKKAKEFYHTKSYMCKSCFKPRQRNDWLKRVFDINLQDYDQLLKKQKNRCALCKTKEPGGRYNFFCVDHNHKTSEIRGLLCLGCNASVIGRIEKNSISIICLIKYLKPSKAELRRVLAYAKKTCNI